MNDPITDVLRAIAEHLPWVFADDWFTMHSSRVGPGFAVVRMESWATALEVTTEIRDQPRVYVNLGPAGAGRKDMWPLFRVTSLRGVELQVGSAITSESVRFLAEHLPWFDTTFADPESRARALALIDELSRR